MNLCCHLTCCLSLCAEKGADCSFVEETSSSSLLLQACLLGQQQVVAALLRCLGGEQEGAVEPGLLTLMRLGNEERITPLMAAVSEGNEAVTMVS